MRWGRSRPRRVAIMGCGPSGLFAAHAFLQAGWDVTVYSRKRRSHMFGAQYLHRPIPGLPEVLTEVSYKLQGTTAGYADKVYGPVAAITDDMVSPALMAGTHPAWDIRAAYFAAWDMYESLVVDANVDHAFLQMEFGNPDAQSYWGAVISTIPAPILCRRPEGEHGFISQKVWAAGDAPELDRWCPITVPPGHVICNGDPERAWYRAANVFGHSTAEWPHGHRPPLSNLAEVEKPISTNCNCWGNITRMGRYGEWKKGVLTHHVYERAAALAAGR